MICYDMSKDTLHQKLEVTRLKETLEHLTRSHEELALRYELLENEHLSVRSDSEEMRTEYNNLRGDYGKLQKDYGDLQEELTKLEEEHAKLKHDYSENVIIQSMNDMKERYEEMIQNTVSKGRYIELNEKYKALTKKATTASVLATHVHKLLKSSEEHMENAGKNFIYRAELELSLIRELIEESL